MPNTTGLRPGGQTTPMEFTERFTAILTFLWDRGARGYTGTRPELAAQVRIPEGAVQRAVTKMVSHGIVKKERGSASFAAGRAPDTLIALMGPDEWRERAATIVAQTKAREAKARKRTTKQQSAQRQKVLERAVSLEGNPAIEAARAEVRLERAPVIAAVFGESEIDVDAWADGADF